MKNPADLAREELIAVTTGFLQILYGDQQEDGSWIYSVDKQWSGADACEAAATLLDRFGLVPGPEEDGTVMQLDGPDDDSEAAFHVLPPTLRYVLFDLDTKRLITTDVYPSYDEACGVANALDDVIIVPLRLLAWDAMAANEADEEKEQQQSQ